MGFKGNCQTCGNLRPLETCVGCGRGVCETHRGDEGSGYWSAEGKKGYGCGHCIKTFTVYEGGMLGPMKTQVMAVRSSIGALEKYITDRLAADVQHAVVDAVKQSLGGKTVDRLAHELVRGVEVHASKLVDHSIKEAGKLVTHSVAELSNALSQQRQALIKVDVEEMASTLERRLAPLARELGRQTAATRRTALVIGIVIAAANFFGIWIGSLVAWGG